MGCHVDLSRVERGHKEAVGETVEVVFEEAFQSNHLVVFGGYFLGCYKVMTSELGVMTKRNGWGVDWRMQTLQLLAGGKPPLRLDVRKC